METIFRKQEIEVVTGDAAWDIRITAANQVAISASYGLQLGVDFAAPPAFANNQLEFFRTGSTHLHAQPVIRKDLKCLDVLIRLACHHRMHPA